MGSCSLVALVEFVAALAPLCRCGWHALWRGGRTACYARNLPLQFFLWWCHWHNRGTALRYATAKMWQLSPPLRPPKGAKPGDLGIFSLKNMGA